MDQFQISDPLMNTFLNQELMKLKCRRFIVLTFVVKQLLLLDDLSLKVFFSLYTTARHIRRNARISRRFYDLQLAIPSIVCAL